MSSSLMRIIPLLWRTVLRSAIARLAYVSDRRSVILNQWRVHPIAMVWAFVLVAGVSWFGSTSLAFASPLPPAPIVAAGSLFSFSGDRPTTLGVVDGNLSPCPPSPNCVSSQSADADHRVTPIPFSSTPEQAIAHLKMVIQSLPRTTIVSERPTYLYAEFTSALMGFVDDVEFSVDPAEQVIQVRSASRLGESDLGVNRKRIETIRSQFSSLE